jgi:small subunit ribosomal protein S17
MADEKNTPKDDDEAVQAEATPVEETPEESAGVGRGTVDEPSIEPVAEADEPAAEKAAPEPEAEAAPEEPAAETEEPAAEEAPAEEPVAEAAPTDEPSAEVDEPAAEAEEPAAEEAPAEEPAAEAEEPAAEEAPAAEAEEPAAAEAPAAQAPAPAAEAPAAPAEEKRPKKRLPRALRHKHSKPKRERTGARKPITRLPKPESELGRRQERRGVVVSDKGDKTIVVKVSVTKSHPKYKKVVRRTRKFHAHDEGNTAAIGDTVRIVETRPLSKTKNWRLAEIVERAR